MSNRIRAENQEDYEQAIAFPSVSIIIQASPIEFSGASAFALNVVNKKPLVYWVIEKLKQITSVDNIVLAVPDIPESHLFTAIAEETGVRVYFGSENNVLDRLIKAAELVGGKVFVKAIGQQYFLDIELLKCMLEYFEKGKFDYVQNPDGFDVNLSAEIATLEVLKKLESLFDSREVGNADFWRTRPLSYIRANKHLFKVGIYENVPFYSDETLQNMREVAKSIFFSERSNYNDERVSSVGNVILNRYRLALAYIKSTDKVLDIACGLGHGSDLLATKAHTVVGADYSPEAIGIAERRYRLENLHFKIDDITSLSFADNEFDAIACIETITHVDGQVCLQELHRVLKPGGLLIISTHQNIHGAVPISPWHLREYGLEEFKDLLSEWFALEKVYGEKLGAITEDEGGEYMIAVCRKRSL